MPLVSRASEDSLMRGHSYYANGRRENLMASMKMVKGLKQS